MRRLTPLAALGRGLAAGLAGTAAMTAYQAAVAIRRGSTAKDAVAPKPPDTWSEAPAPAQVGYRFLSGLFDRRPSPRHATTMTNAVHWAYGTVWGGIYGIAEGTAAANPLVAGTALGTLVFGNAYATLPAMGLYRPPWKYDAKTLGTDWSYHLVYGVTTALAFAGLSRDRR